MSTISPVRFCRNISILLILVSVDIHAQIVPVAVPDIVLSSSAPDGTPMDVAYNPNRNLYYSVTGGSPGVPIWTHDGTTGATVLRTANSTHDWRGIWWNDNLGLLEGNPCSTCPRAAIWSPDLDINGYALATGTVTLSPTNQPDFQSQGDFNDIANEIVYYHSGKIFRVDRATNTNLLTITITGLPVPIASLNVNLIGYTGMSGAEYMVWDYVNEQALFINSSGVYQGSSVVNGGPDTTDSWRVGYANGRVFIWNGAGWNSYIVNGAVASAVPVPMLPLGGLLLLVLTLLFSAYRRIRHPVQG